MEVWLSRPSRRARLKPDWGWRGPVGEYGRAVGLVVEAEVLITERARAALAAVYEDMAAKEGFARWFERSRLWRIDFDAFGYGKFGAAHVFSFQPENGKGRSGGLPLQPF